MDEELEAYRERMAEDANPVDFVLDDNSDGTPNVMSARQATRTLLELEEFFIRHGMYDEAIWAAAATISAKKIAEKSLKQSAKKIFINIELERFCFERIY